MRLPNVLVKDIEPVSFAAGTTIFNAGDPGDRMYVVKEGEVEIRLGDQVVERIGPEGIFGELALIDHEPRSATAVASEDTSLYPVDQRMFLFMVDETPFFAISVMRVMSERLRRGAAWEKLTAR